ncbi:MAG: hypothetical protein ACOVOQ_12555, partial [Flavobacterium sp.]
KLLKNNLFRRADELSTSARGFEKWLTAYLTEANANQFTAIDIRRIKKLHPRTLNRYLQELKMFNYIQVIGGNKHREGFIYKLTALADQSDTQAKIEASLKDTLDKIKGSRSVGQTQVSNLETQLA